MTYLYVGVAGALGAITRYLIGLFLFSDSIFPFATLAVNLVGCYALAFFTSVVLHRTNFSLNVQIAITTGFLGAFTTFSAFSVETVELLRGGKILFAGVYVFFSMVGGIVMTNLGWKRGE